MHLIFNVIININSKSGKLLTLYYINFARMKYTNIIDKREKHKHDLSVRASTRDCRN